MKILSDSWLRHGTLTIRISYSSAGFSTLVAWVLILLLIPCFGVKCARKTIYKSSPSRQLAQLSQSCNMQFVFVITPIRQKQKVLCNVLE